MSDPYKTQREECEDCKKYKSHNCCWEVENPACGGGLHSECCLCACKAPPVDPYEAQGKDFRVNHPTQPKTQVERWEEEIWENIWFITEHHGCYPFEDVACDLQGTDNCSHRMKVKIPELKNNIFLAKQHNPRVSALIGRYQTGTFADDKKQKCFNCEGSNETMWLKDGQCVVCWKLVDKNWKKVTLLDKIKLWLKK